MHVWFIGPEPKIECKIHKNRKKTGMILQTYWKPTAPFNLLISLPTCYDCSTSNQCWGVTFFATVRQCVLEKSIFYSSFFTIHWIGLEDIHETDFIMSWHWCRAGFWYKYLKLKSINAPRSEEWESRAHLAKGGNLITVRFNSITPIFSAFFFTPKN